jgi:electron transport complex protein RnfG
MEKKQVLFYLRVGSILLLICALIALMLAGVYQLTKDAIAAHKAEKIQTAIGAIFADSTSVEGDVPEGHTQVLSAYVVSKDNTTIGHCYTVSANGFGGTVELMVGIDGTGKICGVEVIDHSETKGIGSNVLTSSYLSRYNGKYGNLTLGKDVDAHTGATVTSKAVLSAINAARAAHIAHLEGGEGA